MGNACTAPSTMPGKRVNIHFPFPMGTYNHNYRNNSNIYFETEGNNEKWNSISHLYSSGGKEMIKTKSFSIELENIVSHLKFSFTFSEIPIILSSFESPNELQLFNIFFSFIFAFLIQNMWYYWNFEGKQHTKILNHD